MAKYDVLVNFTDKKAPVGKQVYYAGGTYPHDGYNPHAERVKELQSDKNALKKPLIGAVDKTPAATPAPATEAQEPTKK